MLCVYLEQMNTKFDEKYSILCFHLLLWYSRDVNRCAFFSLLIRIGWIDFIGFDMLFIICITWIKLKLIHMNVVWCMDDYYFSFCRNTSNRIAFVGNLIRRYCLYDNDFKKNFFFEFKLNIKMFVISHEMHDVIFRMNDLNQTEQNRGKKHHVRIRLK